jgi:hypothetical protein
MAKKSKRRQTILVLVNFAPLIIGLATVFFYKDIFAVLFPVLQFAVFVLDIALSHGRAQFIPLAISFAVSTAPYLLSNYLIYTSHIIAKDNVVFLFGYELTWILVPIWIIAIVFCFAFKKSNTDE